MSKPPRKSDRRRIEELERAAKARRLTVSAPLRLRRGSVGDAISGAPAGSSEFWSRLTAVGAGLQAGYYEHQPIRRSGGSWVNDGAAGTFANGHAAMEVNRCANLTTGTIVRMVKHPSGTPLFQDERCP